MRGETNITSVLMGGVQSDIDALKNIPIINLGTLSNLDITYTSLSSYKSVGSLKVYVAEYFSGGNCLILGYHYNGANYGAQLKFKFGTPGLEFRRCSNGTWGNWTTIVS